MASKRRQQKKPVIVEPALELKLDLGSGPRPAEGFKGVDIVDGITDFRVDLGSDQPWPWADNSVDELRSVHFIEHLPAIYHTRLRPPQDALFRFFDEAFRVAKPGATFTLIWPALQSVRAFQDPTHRRFIPAETLSYLSRANREAMGLQHYNVECNWVTLHCVPTIPAELGLKPDEVQQRMYRESWNFACDMVATLRADKP